MTVGTTDVLILGAFAFLAGFIDSVVGGGGLVQLPALLISLPGVAVPTILGTHKLASLAGTTMAMGQYARRVPIPWHSMLPTAAAACFSALLGARLVTLLPSAVLRPVIFVLLILVATYTFLKKDFGELHAPKLTRTVEIWLGILVGAALGFYDGFFGPGTGSFLIFSFIGLFGFSFLSASASAKVVNVATNLSAVLYFAASQHVLYRVAVPMAVCNVAGAFVGTHVAIRRGSSFVRVLFLLVVSAVLIRFAYDLLRS